MPVLAFPLSLIGAPVITVCGGPVLATGGPEKVALRAMLEVKVKPTGKVTVTGVPAAAGKAVLTVAPAGTPLMLTTLNVDGFGVKVILLAAVSLVP